MVLIDYNAVILNGYHWLPCSDSQWLAVILNGYQWLSMVLSGSEWLSVALSGS